MSTKNNNKRSTQWHKQAWFRSVYYLEGQSFASTKMMNVSLAGRSEWWESIVRLMSNATWKLRNIQRQFHQVEQELRLSSVNKRTQIYLYCYIISNWIIIMKKRKRFWPQAEENESSFFMMRNGLMQLWLLLPLIWSLLAVQSGHSLLLAGSSQCLSQNLACNCSWKSGKFVADCNSNLLKKVPNVRTTQQLVLQIAHAHH